MVFMAVVMPIVIGPNDSMSICDKTSLFILLAKDGTIDRKGDGSLVNDLPLQRGISNLGHFDALWNAFEKGIHRIF